MSEFDSVEELKALERRVTRVETLAEGAADSTIPQLETRLRNGEIVDFLLIGCVVLITYLTYRQIRGE